MERVGKARRKGGAEAKGRKGRGGGGEQKRKTKLSDAHRCKYFQASRTSTVFPCWPRKYKNLSLIPEARQKRKIW